jgi:hypothetical protein
MGFVRGDPAAIMMVEYAGESEAEVRSKVEALEARCARARFGYAAVCAYDPEAQQSIWKLRKAGLGLLLGMKGDKKPIAFVEDTAVDPAKLAAFVPLFDAILAKHGALDLAIEAAGDLHVDQHHTVEDVGISFGQALRKALGDKAGIRRYGHCTLPMEETLVTSAIDLGGGLIVSGPDVDDLFGQRSDIVVAELDAGGELLWATPVGSDNGYLDTVVGVVAVGDGAIATGCRLSRVGNGGCFALGLAPAGGLRWIERTFAYPSAIAASGGDLLIAGAAADGDQLFGATFAATAEQDAFVVSVPVATE